MVACARMSDDPRQHVCLGRRLGPPANTRHAKSIFGAKTCWPGSSNSSSSSSTNSRPRSHCASSQCRVLVRGRLASLSIGPIRAGLAAPTALIIAPNPGSFEGNGLHAAPDVRVGSTHWRLQLVGSFISTWAAGQSFARGPPVASQH